MSSALINRSPDLLRLRNAGCEVGVFGAYLVVSNVPYVDTARAVRRGDLVSSLALSGDVTTKPDTHVAFFTGSQPCNADGSPILGLQHGEGPQTLAPGLVVQRSFSNKPPDGYPDYFSKMMRYVTMLSDPAKAVDGSTAFTFKVVPSDDGLSPFVYLDTNTSRAHIGGISAKLEGKKIAIVGTGGTGSYILDAVAKTPVGAIHLFDADLFRQHNAFRAPGAAAIDALSRNLSKVEYLREAYARMHRGIVAHQVYVTAANVQLLREMDFVFLSVDASEDKRHIMAFLVQSGIPFVDCGLGVQAIDGKLLGIVRATTVTSAKSDHVAARVSCAETKDDDYSTNIQIAELNMLNAVMAVLKWKKHFGFYVDAEGEHHSTYTVSGNMLLSEETVS